MAGCFSRVPCIHTGSEYGCGSRNYSASNLWIDFGTVAFLSSPPNVSGPQVENSWWKCLRRTRRSQIHWSILARSVRGDSDRGHGTRFRALAYVLKGKSDLSSSGSRTSGLGRVQMLKNFFEFRTWPLVRVGACPRPDRFRTAAARTLTAREIATLSYLTWREVVSPRD